MIALLLGIAANEEACHRGKMHILCGFLARLQHHHVLEVAIRHSEHRGRWHSQERTHEVKESRAHSDGSQHNDGVQVHRLRLQPGGEHVALKLLDQKHERQDQQCFGDSQGDQGDGHRKRARDDSANERNKARNEGDDGQR